MKKIIALLLVVVIAATVLSVTAFAYTDSMDGYYGGKYWKAALTVRTQYFSCSFQLAGANNLTTTHRIQIKQSNGSTYWMRGTGESGAKSSVFYQGDYSGTRIHVLQAYMSYSYKGLSGSLYAKP
ncbi:MAG: hypothetical protein IIY94_08740 [Oscillospiraceae bacterium]|nr:hypothetical protein [Oscillospiraceae bacterium]